MSEFLLTISETGESGTVPMGFLGDTPVPFTVHIFGAERVAAWQAATDEAREVTMRGILDRLFLLVISAPDLSDAEVASLYNMLCAHEGIDDHAVEFVQPV